jgi:hypothetical protein
MTNRQQEGQVAFLRHLPRLWRPRMPVMKTGPACGSIVIGGRSGVNEPRLPA